METEVRLDGWCEGGLRQQRNDSGGCATTRERSKRVESPGTYVTGREPYTLSGRIGKVVASHAAVARSSPAECTDLYYARGAQGVLPMRVGMRPVNWIYRL